MSPTPVVLAAGQFCAGPDLDENLRACVSAIEEAGRRGAALLLLPEASLCPPPGIFTPSSAAQPLTGPFVTALRAAAARSGVAVVAGSFTPGPDGRSYNTVVAIGPDGEILGSYDKLHLYDAFSGQESTEVQAGPRSPDHDALLTFRLGGITFGVATCYDLRFPEIFRALVDRGATVLLVAAAWMPGPQKQDHWAHLLKARAIENSAFIVAADQCSPSGVGHSQILDPMGRDMAAAGDEPEVIAVTVDPAVVADTRHVNPSVANRRFSVKLLAAEWPTSFDTGRGFRDAPSS